MSVRKLTKSRNAKSFLAITLLAASALVVLGGGIFIQSTHAVSPNTTVTLTFKAGGTNTAYAIITVCTSAPTDVSINGNPQSFVYVSGTCNIAIQQPGSSTERYVFSSGLTVDTSTITSTGTYPFTVYDQFQVNIGYTIPNSPKGSPGPLTDDVTYDYLNVPESVTPPLAPSAPLTEWVDYGSAIKYTSPIVNYPEGWQIDGCFGSCTEATITSSQSVSPDYYHGFAVDVSYTTNDGSFLPGVGPSGCDNFASPDLSYYSFGSVNSGFVCPAVTDPSPIWMDAGSTWTVLENVFPASPTLERWDANMMGLTGTVSGSTAITPEYYNQYAVTASYSVVGGAAGSSAPHLALSSVFGFPQSIKLTGTPTTYWSDDTGTWTVPLNLGGSGSTQRWENPTSLTGPVSGALNLTPGNNYNTYYHQYKLSLSYSTSDGSPIYLSPTPLFNGIVFGSPAVPLGLTTSPQSAWYDAGSYYSVSDPTYVGALPTEHWVLSSSSGYVSAPGAWTNFVYWHQYKVTFGYTVVGGAGTSTAPSVSYVTFGVFSFPVTADGVTTYWADANTAAPNYVATLPGALNPATERWLLTTPPSSISAAGLISPTYTHQYKVTVVANGPGKITGPNHTNWYNAGAVISFTGTPKAHHLFVDWTSNSAGLVITTPTTATMSVTIDGAGTLTAWFR